MTTTPDQRAGSYAPCEFSIRDLTHTIGKAEILHEITLNPPPGRITGLVGPNGSGKSTLLRCVAGLTRPTQGVITVDGRNINSWSRRSLARTIAVMMQHATAVIDLTALQVVALGLIPTQPGWAVASRSDHAQALVCLQQVGATHLAQRRWSELSGGEQQKVQLARAFAQNPRALILDEPTNHLDPAAAWELMEFVRSRKLTTLAAIHDLNLASQFCDWVVMLATGRIVAVGSPDDVLSPPRLAQVYGVTCQQQPTLAGRCGPPITITGLVAPPHGGIALGAAKAVTDR